ncbi:FxSxx-COOH system tetratricopeptide repeat protein [Frankia gtarii]|uniref:FxSxx-COOH system tetratricopeptide repeat protein n=1 Tax=Frankia gtarii TaxID=2950102 RepID=UPI0021C203CE|nr:FxSxx-COOH system tetratricopeptide repeat protein [Frankia gtarii]
MIDPWARTAVDFFVSHAGPDSDWAEWIAQQLIDEGHTIELDVWDWAAGTDFVAAMERALDRAARVIALWSPEYFTRTWTGVEQRPRFASSAKHSDTSLVPVLVRSCPDIPRIYQTLIPIDLVGLSEQQAKIRLLTGLAGPRRPAVGEKKPFPGTEERAVYPAGLPAIWNLPARNLFFTGRRRMLEDLGRRLHSPREPNQVALSALHGVGGVGKSHLALEFSWRHAGDYDVVWWINAEDSSGVESSLVDLATALRIPAHGGATGIKKLVSPALAACGRWLLIYDNVEDLGQLSDLPNRGGHVIVTSRDRDVSDLMATLSVDAFARSESIALLQRRAPHLTEMDADGVAAAVADLPLAVAQAAAYLATTGVGPVDYLRQIGVSVVASDSDGDLATAVPSAPDLHLSAFDGVGLAGTVSAAVNVLAIDDPAALDLLYQLAFLAPEPIPLTAATLGGDEMGMIGGLVVGDPATTAELVQAITRLDLARTSGTRLLIHRRVQEILYKSLPAHRRKAALTRVLRFLASAELGEPTDPQSWPSYAGLTPHLHAVTAHLERIPAGEPAAFRRLLVATCRYLTRSGQLIVARALAEDTLARFQRLLGYDHPDTLDAAHGLARTLRDLGEYGAARAINEDTLDRRRRILGDDHLDSIASAHSIAVVLADLGEYGAARAINEDTLDRRRRILGDDHRDTISSANNLAHDLTDLGDYETARPLAEDTLARRRRLLGDDHPETLSSANSLAEILADLGDYLSARTLAEITLDKLRQVLGSDHPETLSTANILAMTLHNVGDYGAARALAEDTLAKLRQVLGNEHPDTVAAAHSLAIILADISPDPSSD